MKKPSSIMAVVALVAMASGTVFITGCKHHDDHSSSGHEHQYTCKHHPEVIQSTAGNCPKCGMKLTHKE